MITRSDIERTQPEKVIFLEPLHQAKVIRMYDNQHPAQSIAYFDIDQDIIAYESAVEYAKSHDYSKVIIDTPF